MIIDEVTTTYYANGFHYFFIPTTKLFQVGYYFQQLESVDEKLSRMDAQVS